MEKGIKPDSDTDCTHPRYHAAVKYFISRPSNAETHMTAAVLDVLEVLKQNLQRKVKKCLSSANSGDTDLKKLIKQISRVNPGGNLARHGLDTIRRRLRIAVVTSLMRHVRQPDLLRDKYGIVTHSTRTRFFRAPDDEQLQPNLRDCRDRRSDVGGLAQISKLSIPKSRLRKKMSFRYSFLCGTASDAVSTENRFSNDDN